MAHQDKQKMISSKSWLGKFVAYHEIGVYQFVEYNPKKFDGIHAKMPIEYQEQSYFSAFIDGKDINVSYDSIEAAMVGVIAIKFDGANTRADEYFMKAIK